MILGRLLFALTLLEVTAFKKLKVEASFIRYPDSNHGGWKKPWNVVHRYHHELLWWGRYLGGP